ncbi:regulator of Vps4 activity in the MVB pathway-domain-containing protein [Geranomyces variabilis]|nr:regulator of Vps4 activity in the MVB pathway-domain-containing protein [Geranomyces variabilis]
MQNFGRGPSNLASTPENKQVQLKLAINRLKLLQQKKTQLNAVARKEIATLLEKGKEDSARVRVEHIIREDFNIEAMEILELYSELLLARYGLLESMKHCDQAIAEAVNTIIYAAPRTEVKELNMVRDQLIMKFGREFAVAAMENQNDIVNSRIVHKLKVQTPDPVLVDQYLKTIAKAYNVPYDAGTGTDNVLQ